MKRISILLITVFFCFALLCGCVPREQQGETQRLKIVSTIFPSYDFARQVCGELADITMLIPPGSEVHGYEPSLKDIHLLQECDLFLYAGGDSDSWTKDIIKASGNENMVVLSMLDMAELCEEEHSEGMEDVHGHADHDHEAYDEHVWTSPVNAMMITEGIMEQVIRMDAGNAEEYRKNGEEYLEQLERLHEEYFVLAETAERNKLIFAERFPFRYLTEEYGFMYDAAFSGCSSDTEPSLATIAHLMEEIRENNARVIFYIEFSDGRVAEVISQATGAKTALLHSCQNVTQEEFENGATYLQLMQNNLDTLKEALNG